MAKKTIISDFTTGSIPKHLTRFMLPFMASNGLQVLYSLVDMVIVGQFVGSAGLSGVSQGGTIMNLVVALAIGLANSGQIIISQLIGAGKREEIRSVIGTMFTSLISFGALLTAILLLFRGQFVAWLAVPPEARQMAITYVGVCSFGVVFNFGYNVIAAILRGMGDSRHPFLFITISSCTNLVLDYLLTGILGLGVAGAAAATSASHLMAFAAALIFMIRRRREFYFDFRVKSFRIHGFYFRQMVRLGIPVALQSCAINFSMMVVNSFVNQVGVVASATFGVGVKVDDIANKLTLGVQYAAAPMIGQNMGARNPKRVKAVVGWTWLFSGAISAVFMVLYLALNRWIFSLFTTDPAVLELAPVFVSAAIWTFPPMAMMRGSNSLLQGTGSSFIFLCFAILDSGLRVLLSYLVGIAMGFGFYGFTLGFALAPLGVAIPGTLYFFSGRWKNKSMIRRGPPAGEKEAAG